MLTQQFEIENHRRENKNRLGGWAVTIVVHALILLVLFFIYITPPNPPYEDNAGGMTVNYGTSAVGTGDQQQYTTVPVTVQQDAQNNSAASSSATPEDLETQNTEDAALVNTKKNPVKPKDKPNPDALLKPQNKPVVNNTPPTPKANQNALFHPGAIGKPNNSKGDGEGHGQGDQGDPNGDPNSRNYHGGGNGNGNGTGNGTGPGGTGPGGGNVKLAGRHIKARPKFSYNCNARGRIVMAIKVNKSGRVINADFTQLGSTSIDDCLIKRARELALAYTFDENSTAADLQTGSISFDFKEK